MEKFKCDISNDFQTIFSGQKFIKNAKNGSFRRVFFQNLKLAVKQGYQTGEKLVENAKNEKLKCGILGTQKLFFF